MPDFSIMVVAGETSGDQLAAELIHQLRLELEKSTSHLPASQNTIHWFGAGGPRMAEAGVELLADMTQWSAIGISDVARRYLALKRVFHQLLDAASKHQPACVILVDYSHFNHKLARELKKQARNTPWRPFITKFVCPQVWASRPGRARTFHHELDLLLCLFRFEKDWLANHAPRLHAQWIGHPILDRYPGQAPHPSITTPKPPIIAVLPGSRDQELRRHLPVMAESIQRIHQSVPCSPVVVLPHDRLRPLCESCLSGFNAPFTIQIGALAETLQTSTLAIASTGSVTLECALFRVPTIAIYRTSWLTYQIGRRIVTVQHLAMPNILVNRTLFPEFIQSDATPGNLSETALQWLRHPEKLQEVRNGLEEVIGQLGTPGATQRAAAAILKAWNPSHTAPPHLISS